MKRTLLCCLATACVLAMAPAAMAQKPIVVLSFNNVESLLADARYISDLVVPEDKRPPFDMVDQFTEGVDLKKPFGGVVSLDEGGQASYVAFIPVTNLDKVLASLGNFGLQAEDAGNGMKKIGPATIVEEKGYVFIAADPEHLTKLPDPAQSLGTLPQEYDISVRVNVQNIPVFLRQLGLGFIRSGIDQGLEKKEDESDAQFEFRKELAEQQYKQLEQAFNETDQITLGVSVDQEAKQSFLEIASTAKTGTKLAEQASSLIDASTLFGALVLPKAPFALNLSVQNNDEAQIEQGTKQVEAYRSAVMEMIDESEDIDSDEERAIFKELAGEGMDIFKSIVEGGKLDMALVLNQDGDGPVHILAGLYLPDAKPLEALAKKVLTMAMESEENFPKVQFDAAEHAGTKLHTLALPAEDDAEKQAKLEEVFGAKPEVCLGFSKNLAWVGLGTGAIDLLKDAIDNSGEASAKQIIPLQMSLSLAPFLKLGGKFAEKESDREEMKTVAEQVTSGEDRLRFLMQGIDRGSKFRIEIEDGALKAFALIGELASKRHAESEVEVEAEAEAK